MRTVTSASLDAWLDSALPFLTRREAAHAAMLASALNYARPARADLLAPEVAGRSPAVVPPGTRGVLVEDAGVVVGAALLTHGFLLLSEMPTEAARRMGRDFTPSEPPQAVQGPREVVEAFGSAAAVGWTEGQVTQVFARRTPFLTQDPTGRRREAREEEREVLVGWMLDFARGNLRAGVTRDAAARMLDGHLRQGEVHVWVVEDEPRAMAVTTAATATGVSVTGMYTPPEWRRSRVMVGFVRALHNHLLASGWAFTYFLTTQGSAVSRAVDALGGYEEVTRTVEARLEPPRG